jgi:hypothetical protein
LERSPYRVPANEEVASGKAERWFEVDLLVAAGLLWAVSLVRVVGAFLRQETFGPEATIAFMAVGGLPWMVLRRHREKVRP